MSPKKKIAAASDVFTAILALATCVSVATAAYVAFTCYTYYGTIFQIVQSKP